MDSDGAFREVNDSIRKLASSSSEIETWEFFCECPDLACHALVTLTIQEFDERRAASPPVPIVAAHGPLAAARGSPSRRLGPLSQSVR
jgi:hypothetical protein